LTVAEKKREWFDRKRSELHARGMKDTHIAEQMGIKRPYFSEVANGATIGDAFIDKMCSAFGMRFPDTEQVKILPNNPGTVTVDKQLFSDLLEQVKTQTRLLNAVLDKLDRHS